MIGTAGLLLLRPYALSLKTLETVYGVQLSVQVLGISWFVGGLTFVLLRIAGRKTFFLCFTPVLVYVLCLTWAFFLTATAGPLAMIYGWSFCYVILHLYVRRANMRDYMSQEHSDD